MNNASNGWSPEAMDLMFQDLFAEGFTSILTGKRGAAKSTWAAWALNWLLPRNYKIATNMIFKKCVGVDDDGIPTFIEAYPSGVKKVRNFCELFLWIGRQILKDRSVKLVWILDEAGVAISSVKPVMTVPQRAFIYFGQMQRKFNTSSLFIAPSPEMIGKTFRTEGGFMGAHISKSPYDMQKYARDEFVRRDKYGRMEMFTVRMYEHGAGDVNVEVFTMDGVTEMEYCKPAYLAKEGDIVFSSKSAATFTMGYFSGTKVRFSVEDCLDYISDCIEEEVAMRIIEFIDNKGFTSTTETEETTAKKGSAEYKEMEIENIHRRALALYGDQSDIGWTELCKVIGRETDVSWRTVMRYLEQTGFKDEVYG